MYSVAEVKNLDRIRQKILIPAIFGGLAITFGYFGLAILVRDELVAFAGIHFGKFAADITPIVLILPSVAPFLAILLWAERRAKAYAIICPNCGSDQTRSTARILATLCCKNCLQQIVAGERVRKPEVFNRYARVRWRRYLVYWFWAWPALGVVMLIGYWLNPRSFEPCLHVLFVPGFTGTIAAGWAFTRTFDRRYLPQMGASAVTLAIGGILFWTAFW